MSQQNSFESNNFDEYRLWLSQRIQRQPIRYQRAIQLLVIFYRYRIKADRDIFGRRIDPISLDPISSGDVLWIPLEPHPKYPDIWRDQAFHFDYFHMWIGTRRAPIHPLLNRPLDPYQTRSICEQYDKRGIHPPYCMRTPSGRVTRSMTMPSTKPRQSKKANKESGLKEWTITPCPEETYRDAHRIIDGCRVGDIEPKEIIEIVKRNQSKRNRYHIPFIDWCVRDKDPSSLVEYQNSMINSILTDRQDLVLCLLELGATICFVDAKNGFAPLHLAMYSQGRDSPKILEALLECHANEGIALESRMGSPEDLTADMRKLELYFRSCI